SLAVFRLCLSNELLPFVLRERCFWAFANSFSYCFVYLLFLNLTPSEVIAKSFKPKSIPQKEPVFSFTSYCSSDSIDTKYFPVGVLLKVHLLISPLTAR